MIQIQCTPADIDARPMHEPKVSGLDKHQHRRKCTGFESFFEQQDLRMSWLNSYTTEKQLIICSCLWKIKGKMAFKMPLNMKNINNFTKWKNASVDVRITQQKHLSQSGRSTWTAVDIFNTLRVFTKEPISEQETKLECMNIHQRSKTDLIYSPV